MMQFEEFYITWFSRAIIFARDYVLSADDAENIVQDVFLHLYERRELMDFCDSPVAYLFTAVKNRCLDCLRRRMAERDAVEALQSELTMELKLKYDSLEIFDTAFGDEPSVARRIEQALQKLPDRCREIFVMNKLEGKKQRQIAEELNISVNTVETQMGVAYKKLREELKDCLPLLAFLCACS